MFRFLRKLFGKKREPLAYLHGTVRHRRPSYYGYTGGWADLSECNDCKRIALYEDMHPAECCPNCGGVVVNNKVGVWEESEHRWKTRDKISRQPRDF